MSADGQPIYTDKTPRVAAAIKLHRASVRAERGLFLAEGRNAVEAALAAGVVTDLFLTEAAEERFADLVDQAYAARVYVHLMTQRAAEKLADTTTTTGLIAVCREVVRTDLAELPDAGYIVIGVDTNDPGNAGTMIRLADAQGAAAVVLCGASVDPHNAKVVRATAGSLFSLPVFRVSDTAAVLEAVASRGFTVAATTSHDATPLPALSDHLTGQVAWLFGNEAHGLADELVQAADLRVAIPMYGTAESLNLATAAAICLYATATAHHHHS